MLRFSYPPSENNPSIFLRHNGTTILYSDPLSAPVGRGGCATVRALSLFDQTTSLSQDSVNIYFALPRQVESGRYLIKYFHPITSPLAITIEGEGFGYQSEVLNEQKEELNTLLEARVHRYKKYLYGVVNEEAVHFINAHPHHYSNVIPFVNDPYVYDIQYTVNGSQLVLQATVTTEHALLVPRLPGETILEFRHAIDKGVKPRISFMTFLEIAKSILNTYIQFAYRGSRHADVGCDNLLIDKRNNNRYFTSIIDTGHSRFIGKKIVTSTDAKRGWSPDRVTDKRGYIAEREYHDGFGIAGIFIDILESCVQTDSYLVNALLVSFQDQLMTFRERSYESLTFGKLSLMITTYSMLLSTPEYQLNTLEWLLTSKTGYADLEYVASSSCHPKGASLVMDTVNCFYSSHKHQSQVFESAVTLDFGSV